MLKLVGGIVVDALLGIALLGIALAGLVLAIGVPTLIGTHIIAPGDSRGFILIAGVIAGLVAVMLIRPGGAWQRYRRRGE